MVPPQAVPGAIAQITVAQTRAEIVTTKYRLISLSSMLRPGL
jgi:hypothetical protein